MPNQFDFPATYVCAYVSTLHTDMHITHMPMDKKAAFQCVSPSAYPYMDLGLITYYEKWLKQDLRAILYVH